MQCCALETSKSPSYVTLHLPQALFHVHSKADISDSCSPLSSHDLGQETSKVSRKRTILVVETYSYIKWEQRMGILFPLAHVLKLGIRHINTHWALTVCTLQRIWSFCFYWKFISFYLFSFYSFRPLISLNSIFLVQNYSSSGSSVFTGSLLRGSDGVGEKQRTEKCVLWITISPLPTPRFPSISHSPDTAGGCKWERKAI